MSKSVEHLSGIDLDEAVALEVLGWSRPRRAMPEGDIESVEPGRMKCTDGTVVTRDNMKDFSWRDETGGSRANVPNYSMDIGLAFVVVEHLMRRGRYFGLSHDYPAHDEKWVASFGPDGSCDGEGATAPEAICRAAVAEMRKHEAK